MQPTMHLSNVFRQQRNRSRQPRAPASGPPSTTSSSTHRELLQTERSTSGLGKFLRRPSVDRKGPIHLFRELHAEGCDEYKYMKLRELYQYILQSTHTPRASHSSTDRDRPAAFMFLGAPADKHPSTLVEASDCENTVDGLDDGSGAELASSAAATQVLQENVEAALFSVPPAGDSPLCPPPSRPPNIVIPNPEAKPDFHPYLHHHHRQLLRHYHRRTPRPIMYYGVDHTPKPFPRDYMGSTVIPRSAGLHARDLRKLTTAVSSLNELSIFVRRQTILLNLDPIRAIVLWDRLIVLIPDGADNWLLLLESKLREKRGDVFNASASVDLMAAEEASVMSDFEFAAVEAVLATLCTLVVQDLELLKPQARALQALLQQKERSGTPTPAEQEQLRLLKTTVVEQEARVRNLRRAIINVLDEEEDVEDMCLTYWRDRDCQKEDDHNGREQMEMLLEAYLQDLTGVGTELELLRLDLTSTENLLLLRLDTARNQLLEVTTVFTFFSFFVSLANLAGAFFGMNLNNGYDAESPASIPIFNQVVGYSTVSAVILTIIVHLYLRKIGILVE